jgi:hypothetical protein
VQTIVPPLQSQKKKTEQKPQEVLEMLIVCRSELTRRQIMPSAASIGQPPEGDTGQTLDDSAGTDVGVVVVDHGSKRAEANAMLEEFVRSYKCAAWSCVWDAGMLSIVSHLFLFPQGLVLLRPACLWGFCLSAHILSDPQFVNLSVCPIHTLTSQLQWSHSSGVLKAGISFGLNCSPRDGGPVLESGLGFRVRVLAFLRFCAGNVSRTLGVT